jgi:hypothetical protein
MTVSYCSVPSNKLSSSDEGYYQFTTDGTFIIKSNIRCQIYALKITSAVPAVADAIESPASIVMEAGVYTIVCNDADVHIKKKTQATINLRNELESTTFDSIKAKYDTESKVKNTLFTNFSSFNDITAGNYSALKIKLDLLLDTDTTTGDAATAKAEAIDLLMDYPEKFIELKTPSDTIMPQNFNEKTGDDVFKTTPTILETATNIVQTASCIIIRTASPVDKFKDFDTIQANLKELVYTIKRFDETFYDNLVTSNMIISTEDDYNYTDPSFNSNCCNIINNHFEDNEIYHPYDSNNYNTSNFFLKDSKTFEDIFIDATVLINTTTIEGMITNIEDKLSDDPIDSINDITYTADTPNTIAFDVATLQKDKKFILLNLHSYYQSLKHMKKFIQYERLQSTVINDLNDVSLKVIIQSVYDDLNDDLNDNTQLKTDAFTSSLVNTKNDYEDSIIKINNVIKDSTKNANLYNTSKSFHSILSHDSILYDYLLYIVIIYILLTIIFFIYTSLNIPDKMIPYIYISLTITIVFYIITALLSIFNTTNESFTTNDSHNALYTDTKNKLELLSQPYREINNALLSEFAAIINNEKDEKSKKADIDKLVSQYNLNKIKSINNNEKHSSKFNKDFTELLYMLLIILLVGILLYDSFNNIYTVGCIVLPIYCILILSFFVNMHRKTRTGFNKAYW